MCSLLAAQPAATLIESKIGEAQVRETSSAPAAKIYFVSGNSLPNGCFSK
jgi:hypothetical protein